MSFEELTQNTSPYLLCWIDLAMVPKPPASLHDLKKIKRLADKDFPVPHSDYTAKKLAPIQDFLRSRKGDWALLGELTGLQVLEFPKRTPPDVIDDFSFLPKLKNLRRLSLTYTSFSDCSLLAGLTQLKYLYLPARKKLIHTEVLSTLSCEIRTDEAACSDDSFPAYRTIPVQKVPSPPAGTFAVRCLEYGRNTFTNAQITPEVVSKLADLIRAGAVDSLLLSSDENGEEDFFTMDIGDGWAAPTFNTWDDSGKAIFYQPINEAYTSVEDDAPVEIGGQTPVPKRFALNDLDLAAECAVYFAKTGKLYPGVPWAEFT